MAENGRWNGIDPLADKREWLTSYNYVQNNPILRIDPNGAFDTKADAKQFAKENDINTGWFSRSKIQRADDGSYAINNRKEHTSISNDKDFGITTGTIITAPRIADAEIVSLGVDFAFLGGAGYSLQGVKINKGDDQGWHFYNTTNANIGLGASLGLSSQQVDFNEKNDAKIPLDRDAFAGNGNAYTAGAGELGGVYGYALTNGKHSMNPMSKNKLYSTMGFGFSVGFDIGAMWQGSNSKLIGPAKKK